MTAAAAAGMGLLLSSCSSPHDGAPGVRLVAARPGTEVQFLPAPRHQIADIHCPLGFGWAEFHVPPGFQPDRLVFRLHLRGLEGCGFEHNGSKVQVAVSSHGDCAIRQWRENGDPVGEGDRIPVSIVSASGGPSRIPLDGWFELRLPKSCRGGCSLRLSWVDFYR